MNTTEIRNRLNEKLANLSSEQLYSVWDFIQSLEGEKLSLKTDEKKDELLERWKKLFKESQQLFADNPLTEAEIQAEIDAYREGK